MAPRVPVQRSSEPSARKPLQAMVVRIRDPEAARAIPRHAQRAAEAARLSAAAADHERRRIRREIEDLHAIVSGVRHREAAALDGHPRGSRKPPGLVAVAADAAEEGAAAVEEEHLVPSTLREREAAARDRRGDAACETSSGSVTVPGTTPRGRGCPSAVNASTP